jgi:N6-adenosine-specific RNA methylase IME4
MWWVATQPIEALSVVRAWGFKLKTMTGFNWIKTTKHDKPFFGMGSWTRAGSECCLIATKGKPQRRNASIRSVIESPCIVHSRKPIEVKSRINSLCGPGLYLELFARETTPGWDVFGDQVSDSIKLS